MFARVDHIGVAGDDLDGALALYGDTFGMAVAHREVVEEQGVEAVLLDVGENHVELLRPLSPDTAVGRFLAARGPGLHHVAYQVGDVEAALRRLRELGVGPEEIAHALAGQDHDGESAAAAELLRRRFPGSIEGDRERDRALRLLVRRGYGLELAHDAIRAHAG